MPHDASAYVVSLGFSETEVDRFVDFMTQSVLKWMA